MTKKTPPERFRKKGVEGLIKAPKHPKSAEAEKLVTDRKKSTRRKVEKTLAPKIPNFSETLSTKEGLKSIIRRYLRDCVKTPKENLEETTNLTLQELSKECDESGRSLDSIYWFAEGTFVQIKNGKLSAKKREGRKVQILISGKEIKVVTPEPKPAEEQPIQEPIPEPAAEAPVAQPAAVKSPAPTAEPAPAPEVEPQAVATAESVAAQLLPAAELAAAPAETMPPAESITPAPEPITPAETAKPVPLPPALITLLTKTNIELLKLRGEFEFYASQPANITSLTDLNKQVTALGDAFLTLPDQQFTSDEVRFMREKIAALKVEIEELIQKTTVNEVEKRAREMPSILKGLTDRINTLRENANTWKTEVECITRSSRVPTSTELNNALDKYNTLLIAESDKLREQINDIEKSPVYNDDLKAKLDLLKTQISEISIGLEAPVRELHECLQRLPASNGGQSNVVRLRPARSGSTATKSVDATDVLTEPDSLFTKALRWVGLKK